MAHPLRKYARAVQCSLGGDVAYTTCLRFVIENWKHVRGMAYAQRRTTLAQLARDHLAPELEDVEDSHDED